VARGGIHRAILELRLLRSLRAVLRRESPTTVISFATETNVRVLLAAGGLGVRVVVSERSDPATMPLDRVWALLRRVLYGLADCVVLQTEEAREWIATRTTARHCTVIPNPVTLPAEETIGPPELPQPLAIAMGRLRPEKGFDMLLEAFAIARVAHPDWHLAIVGDGPERRALELRVDALDLRKAVTFVGTSTSPGHLLRQGRLFVLPSRFEGFPNALLEAMACGLAVISFDCPSGPRAIIRDEVDGILVPAARVDALAAQLVRLMADDALRIRLGAAARSVRSRFAMDRIVSQWLAASQPTARRTGAPAGVLAARLR
jgi:GalNAc-alpha-(1->4)-GalNAc-alpha-(1->3)-diNAcBac-PP-undecaprenol alpha-1,4-N-acetyl-D-galactosaminyltransferase